MFVITAWWKLKAIFMFNLLSAGKRYSDLGMYKKIIEASIEMGDPLYTHSSIL